MHSKLIKSMKIAALVVMVMFLSGCVQPPMPISYYLAKQQSEYEVQNKAKRAELQKSFSENSCNIFWQSVRTRNIVNKDELKNGQICLDIKNQIHNLPSIYIDNEKIAFTRSYNEMKVILASMQNGKTPLHQGLTEMNNLYDYNNAQGMREITKSNTLIKR